MQFIIRFDKKSHIKQVSCKYIGIMKKIVAHIHRTVTISIIETTLDVSVSEDSTHTPAFPPLDPECIITNPEGEKEHITENTKITHNIDDTPFS